MKIPTRPLLLGALVLPAVLLVGGCGAQSSNDAQTGSTTEQAPGDPRGDLGVDSGVDLVPAGPAGLAADGETAYRASDAKAAPPESKAVISQGQISLRAPDIDKARFELQKMLDTWNGTISNEQSDADDEGKTVRARLELRVPSPRFDAAMNELGDLGTLVDRSRTSEDVTTQVIDNEARIRSQRLSLERVQSLLAQARDLSQVIAIEAQLSRRQADLDSLEQQQKYLADQTTLATINVYLTVPDKADETDETTFWSGLRSGWEHLGASTSATLTGIGTVLPFAVVLALIGLPGWIAWRRRTNRAVPETV